MATKQPQRAARSKPKGRVVAEQTPVAPNRKSSLRSFVNFAFALLALALVGAIAALSQSIGPEASPAVTPVSHTATIDTDKLKIETLAELLKLPPDERAEVDIARANLLVAKATPGGEGIDVEGTLQTLDRWANIVADETDRLLPKFHANPGDYSNSEGYFRILSLVTVLQQDCGVRYNPQRINEPDFTNPEDLFIHGMVGGDGGTCVSMPVLYTAIARRLGYPVSLVTTKAHIFARWEDTNGETFNIEATGRGLNVYSDEHYTNWPMRVTHQEIERFRFLETLDANATIAVFLGTMGHVFADTGSVDQALAAYRLAASLDRGNGIYDGFASQIGGQSPDQSKRRIARSGRRRTNEALAELRDINEINRRNQERLNRPNRPAGGPAHYPSPPGR